MKTIRNYELKVRRVTVADASEPYGKSVHAPSDVQRLAKVLIGDSAHEVFCVFLLDVKNRVVGYTEVGRGGVDMCPVDVRAVFRIALVVGAAALIVAHCHPSGDPSPSKQDIELTERLKKAADLLSLSLLDHVIVTTEECTSLRERGLMV